MSIYVYDREHNYTKYFIYWIPKTRTLGVKDSKDLVYEKVVTIQERMELLKVSKTLVEEKWSDLFAQCGLHIEAICEKELVLTFALQRNITLEKTELTGMFDELLYLEYLRLKTLVNSSPNKRKRTASAVENFTPSTEDNKADALPVLVPLKKRTTRITAKSTGPQFEFD